MLVIASTSYQQGSFFLFEKVLELNISSLELETQELVDTSIITVENESDADLLTTEYQSASVNLNNISVLTNQISSTNTTKAVNAIFSFSFVPIVSIKTVNADNNISP